MIFRQTIDGRDATIAYLTNKFAPAAPDAAQFVKVLFDDGEMIILATGIPPAKRGVTIHGHSLAAWASHIAAADINRLDKTIRTCVMAGLDNTEVARAVVGSMKLQGVDGATEVTRHHISQLARTAIRSRKKKPR
jgi:hypothetical protein